MTNTYEEIKLEVMKVIGQLVTETTIDGATTQRWQGSASKPTIHTIMLKVREGVEVPQIRSVYMALAELQEEGLMCTSTEYWYTLGDSASDGLHTYHATPLLQMLESHNEF